MTPDSSPTSDPVEEFFRELGHREPDPAWADVRGAVGIEMVDGNRTEHWLVTIDKGRVAVSRAKGDGGCSIRFDRALGEQLIRGEANAMAAVLRGSAVPMGDLELLLALQRIFPGPPDQQRPAPIGRSNRWEA